MHRHMLRAILATAIGAIALFQLWRGHTHVVPYRHDREDYWQLNVRRILTGCIVAIIFFAWGWVACAHVWSGRSWGKFGGNCFEVLETGDAGCEASYTDHTTVTLRVQ